MTRIPSFRISQTLLFRVPGILVLGFLGSPALAQELSSSNSLSAQPGWAGGQVPGTSWSSIQQDPYSADQEGDSTQQILAEMAEIETLLTQLRQITPRPQSQVVASQGSSDLAGLAQDPPRLVELPPPARSGAEGNVAASEIDSAQDPIAAEVAAQEERLRQIRQAAQAPQMNGLTASPDPQVSDEGDEMVILSPAITSQQIPPPPLAQVPARTLDPITAPDPVPTLPPLESLASPLAQVPEADLTRPEDVSPIQPIAPLEPDPLDQPTIPVVNIPTSHRVGALNTGRATARISIANPTFAQFRALDDAIGGSFYRQLDRDASSNIAEISPDNPVPLTFSYSDSGVGVDNTAVNRTLFTTTTVRPSAVFDYSLAGFAAYQGPIAGCVSPIPGTFTAILPNSILIDPETGEAFFAPAGGNAQIPSSGTLGGVSIDTICRPVSIEVVADVLANPQDLIRNPEALVFVVENVEIVDTEALISRRTEVDREFTVIPTAWSYVQQDLVGQDFTGSSSILRQWYVDPRADLATTLVGLGTASILPSLEAEATVEGIPDEDLAAGVLKLNPDAIQARELLASLGGRPNDSFRPSWATYRTRADNVDPNAVPDPDTEPIPVTGFGFEIGTIETSRLIRVDESNFFTPTTDKEVFVDVPVSGGGAGINVRFPEQSVDFFVSGGQPNTAVAVQIEVLRALGINTSVVEEEFETNPALALNYGYSRVGDQSQLVIRPSLQYSPLNGELGLALGGAFQAQLGDVFYSLSGRYHTSDLFSYDGLFSTVSVPVVREDDTRITFFSSQSLDTRPNASSVVVGSNFGFGPATFGVSYRPALVNDLTLLALSWTQAWAEDFSTQISYTDSNQGTGTSFEARRVLGRNQDIVVRFSNFNGDTTGLLGDLQGTQLNQSEISVEARF